MTRKDQGDDRGDGAYPVPGGRLGRMLRLGGMTSGVLGGMAATGVRQMAQGQRPSLPALLLTPRTARRVARDLGRMRGAAMKLGQMLSMDTGLVLPPEVTAILAALRDDAPHMPPKQLQEVLNAEWGPGWLKGFARFDVRPFAAASIGQVHRARTRDGRDLAIKVQYPGVRASIDSDIGNVATLLRLPGLAPSGMDLAPLLREARRQLHLEADYLSEARRLTAFCDLLAGSATFRLPELQPDLSTPQVLAMSYVEGRPIEALAEAPQALRDHVASHLIDLVLRELFSFGLMQTDPNLANYRYDEASRRIVLLDFGAVIEIAPGLAQDFRDLLNAALDGDPCRNAEDRLFRRGDRAPPPGADPGDVRRRHGAPAAVRALRLRRRRPDRAPPRHGPRDGDGARPGPRPPARHAVPPPQDRRDLPAGDETEGPRQPAPDAGGLSLTVLPAEYGKPVQTPSTKVSVRLTENKRSIYFNGLTTFSRVKTAPLPGLTPSRRPSSQPGRSGKTAGSGPSRSRYWPGAARRCGN